ncbi:MAG: diacylglycerol kinase family lipid kinase [Candidatus Thermoplasmatota archaeon]|nr:diacylglycerol kinase family lipid kinase [Candidatus Thermoplasmatota archaeon]
MEMEVVPYSIIYNPNSATAKNLNIPGYIEKEMCHPPLIAARTTGMGHATAISREILEDGRTRLLFIAGGDGTLNEAVQPLVKTDMIICVFPTGTGSDFARSLGILNIEHSVMSAKNGHTTRVDCAVCTWNGRSRYFLNIMEVGFGAMVMDRVNSSDSRDRHVFTRSVFRELMHLKSYNITIAADEIDHAFITPEIIVANGRYFGRGMKASPESSLTDGMLDIHVIGKIGRLKLLRKFGSLKSGDYIRDPVVTNIKASKIEISGFAPVEIDGEVVDPLPVSVSVVPRSLTFTSMNKC